MSGPPPGTKLGIICGGGEFPALVARGAEARGWPVTLFPLKGWADPARVAPFRHRWVPVGAIGGFVAAAKAEGIADIVFIGTVMRPPWRRIRIDWTTLMLVPRFVRMFRGGDNHLLTELALIFEQRGIRVWGAHEIAPEITVGEGALGARHPGAADEADIRLGLSLLRAMSPFDVGQAVVVAQGHVLAVEAAEGTDAMLARITALRETSRTLAPPGTGVLVKAPKHGQERRLDLPSIGRRTVENAKAAGLAGIALAAGGTLIADPQAVIAAADRAGLFVAGLRDDE